MAKPTTLPILESFRKGFKEKKVKEIRGLVSSGNFSSVVKIYEDQQVVKLVGINAQDPVSGNTLLHDAVEMNLPEMVEWCLKMKADPLVRDKRGRLAAEKTRNERIKQLLKDGNTHYYISIFHAQLVLNQAAYAPSTPVTASSKMQGILYKWTNYASGYKKRWFVLDEGVLSYYTSQEDFPVACRGSVSLRVAKLAIDASDRQRFDITGRGNLRWHLRAEHPMEAKRWFVALTEAKQWLQDNTEFETKVEATRLARQDANGSGTYLARRDEISPAPSSRTRGETTVSLVGSTMPDDMDQMGDQNLPPPHGDTFQATLQSAVTCLQFQDHLLTTSAKLLESVHPKLLDTFRQSSATLSDIMNDIMRMVRDREHYFQNKLEKEEEKTRMWEENLRLLAVEHESLQSRAAQQVDRLLETVAKTTHSVNELAEDVDEKMQMDDDDEFFDAEDAGMRESIDALSPVKSSFIPPGYPSSFRTTLPMADSDKKVEISLWSILKNSIGKDLSKIPLPVFFNEPLSMLQRFCEDMEYAHLLDIASMKEDSCERMQYVAAFAMTNYASTIGRVGKPFNPLLGETYEYVRPDKGFRYIAEQVCHHPPISACYGESENYIYWGEVNLKTKFWGKSLEIIPLGVFHVILKKSKEHYTWKKVTSCVNNLIVGKIWLDNYGDMVIKNHATGDTCNLNFKAAGWRGKGQYEIEGHIQTKSGERRFDVWGKWNDKLMSRPTSSSTGTSGGTDTMSLERSGAHVLWKRVPLPPNADKMFQFTQFAVSLNEMTGEMEKYLCPTDSRLRPDQRAMENGQFEDADKLKQQLEEMQRTRRKKRAEEGMEWTPVWFYKDIDEDTNEEHWVYKGGYWESREQKKWDTIPMIFSNKEEDSGKGKVKDVDGGVNINSSAAYD